MTTRSIERKLAFLREQFSARSGRPFEHFVCPFLYVDEPADLCKAHIVNRAFGDASTAWTVQRKDIDNFFGSMFEADFVDLKSGKHGIAMDAILDPALYRRFRPRVMLDGNEIPHFIATGPLPPNCTELVVEDEGRSARLGLRIPPGLELREGSNLYFEVKRDFRVAAVASVLKAAHLTAFELMDYTYALSVGGRWLGELLGEFYRQNRNRSREQVQRHAVEYFRDCTALVRPVESAPPVITGTVDDRWVHLCWSDDREDRKPWALLFYIRAAAMLHTVLVPVFEHDAGAIRFAQFLDNSETSFDTSIGQFCGSHWTVASERRRVRWPSAQLD